MLPKNVASLRTAIGRVCFASVAAIMIAGAAEAETWRFATLLSSENPISKMLQSAAEEIEAETEGRVTFQVAYGGESGLNPRQYLDAVKTGIIEGAVISSSGAASNYPWFGAYNVPFLAPNIALRRPMFEATQPMMDDFLAERGIVPLAYPLHAPRWSVMYLATPAYSLADLSGRLIRAYDPQTIALVEGLGAAPVTLEKSEVYLGLQRNTIDGAITDIAAAKEESYAEVAAAVLRLNPLFLPNIVGVNQATFEDISTEDQETVRRVFGELQEAYWQEISPEGEDDSFDYVEEHGLEVIIPDEEMSAALLQVRDAQLEAVRATGEMGAQVVETLQSVLEQNGY